MNLIGKLQPVIIIAAALAGIILGSFTSLGSISSGLIEIFLMLLLYVLFLSVDLKQIKKSLTNIRYTGVAVVINFIITPVTAYVLGKMFFGNSVDIRIGLLMLLIPFVLSVITKIITANKKEFQNFISEQCDNLQLLFLCLAVVSMFASEGRSLMENPMLLLEMFIPLLIFFTFTFLLAQGIGRMLKFEKRDIVALNFTTLARNSPLSLAIAVATFPDKPLISLALVIGPLIELPVLSIVSAILLRWNKD